ncbi:unnamed protein product, partial [marine sediment metagenome]
MKKIFLIISLFFASLWSYGNDMDSIVLAGNEHYMNGEYELA